ncbi:Lipoyltransferase and lipoate-protein ligase [Punctularia strigosozonata HHB-11173 SS5]|uniref:Lipoyltransferase and lipoate-protein ligase n=1 Tax=Punctularia strigosozonata (strain HHB-11173) TaxID=741275 RepID=UPI000441651F|nr:Lipoyltransferase and lipoate-protein ligase [Punctularia strigosozonata HHB-11173 SS5]EIN10496.1 Lipoyltransferase and lipoate-protein ligase [Punctularia strigosozonata HHB-11173 SS5]
MLGLVARTSSLSRARWHRSVSSLVPTKSIYVSESSNPYFNLTLEDWLFRHKPHKEPLLLLYRDEPCVVIGRNQNPWKEINLPALNAAGIPFIRRRSGGGTVYHDMGNTNFSIHLPRSSFDRDMTSQVILNAVRSLGINAFVNARNDLCVGENKMSFSLTRPFMHVSGSAYKIVNNRAYHHGTMLLTTRLDTLGDLLRSNKMFMLGFQETMVTKGVASVRSPVCNLSQFKPSIDHSMFVNAVIKSFRGEYDIDVDDETVYVSEAPETHSIPYIKSGMEELRTWDWAYGQTPEFTYSLEFPFPWGKVQSDIHSKHGIILDCTFSVIQDSTAKHALGNHEFQQEIMDLQQLGNALKSKKYGFVDDSAFPQSLRDRRYGLWHTIWQSMKAAMSS